MTISPEVSVADPAPADQTTTTAPEPATPAPAQQPESVTSPPTPAEPAPAEPAPAEPQPQPKEPEPKEAEPKEADAPPPFQAYEFAPDNFTIPDGITYDPAQATDFHQTLNGIAERHGLTQEQAAAVGQDMIDLFAVKMASVNARISELVNNSVAGATDAAAASANEAAQKAIADRIAANTKALSEDREYLALGGDKAAQAFRNELFTAAERTEIDKVLTAAGLHNDPVLNKAFARMRHSMTSETGAFIPGNPATAQTDRMTRMYGPQ